MRDRLGMMLPAMWLISRNIAEAAGPWDELLSLADDAEYFTRVLLESNRVLFCEGARCYYRSGIEGSLSSKKSHVAFESRWRVIELCEKRILDREDSERIRTLFAVQWQIYAHTVYPYYPKLANSALQRAKKLHPLEVRPAGGPVFSVVSGLVGWKFARRLQVATGRH